jgi:hypothetical protein
MDYKKIVKRTAAILGVIGMGLAPFVHAMDMVSYPSTSEKLDTLNHDSLSGLFDQGNYYTTQPMIVKDTDPGYKKLIFETKRFLMEEYDELFCTTSYIYNSQTQVSSIFNLDMQEQKICDIPKITTTIYLKDNKMDCLNILDGLPDYYYTKNDIGQITSFGEIMYDPQTHEPILAHELYSLDIIYYEVTGNHLYEDNPEYSQENNIKKVFICHADEFIQDAKNNRL